MLEEYYEELVMGGNCMKLPIKRVPLIAGRAIRYKRWGKSTNGIAPTKKKLKSKRMRKEIDHNIADLESIARKLLLNNISYDDTLQPKPKKLKKS